MTDNEIVVETLDGWIFYSDGTIGDCEEPDSQQPAEHTGHPAGTSPAPPAP